MLLHLKSLSNVGTSLMYETVGPGGVSRVDIDPVELSVLPDIPYRRSLSIVAFFVADILYRRSRSIVAFFVADIIRARVTILTQTITIA